MNDSVHSTILCERLIAYLRLLGALFLSRRKRRDLAEHDADL